ncbi:selenocysteine-specific translation elongation factor [uncultured Paludibaculum sp.]|uniref:selenocysteine-specific translation elongation factor n=1 Tax=uncultured Paludibaculum sp. TaxID=1765020 RepID=UPI002AAB19F5|nr:selenocysteine-specific translation elongation factor [uncultured Paludibaculum sp.]
MKNIIVGTAGHIDHGKTTLVRALTGIDTDRLEEEKRRGITIDLGFAHLEHAGVRFGFVDVPGHERFVKNMLAGAGGIDMVLLVIGADESIKPQTREHFDICRLLGIQQGLVVLTKADSVDEDILELARMEAAEFVAGSFLEGAPILAVSGVTGAGLPALREAMAAMAGRAANRDTAVPFRLPIDRSFTLKGFGTVVTGTLTAGQLAVEQEVEVHPGGRLLRVRGVQVHGGAVSKASAGQRTAVNLAGVEASELARGMVLTPPGLFHATQAIDCSFTLLPGAQPLKHRAPIHFHAGTAEVEAQVRMLRGTDPLQPGTAGFVRLLLKEPLLLLPGDRFIARMFSPVITIGGGVVLDNAPPLRMKKPQVLERLALLETAALPARMALFAREDADGCTVAALVARMGVTPETLAAAAPAAGLVPVRAAEPRLIARSSLDAFAEQLRRMLAGFHRQNPLLRGMSRAAAPAPIFLLDTLVASMKDVVAEEDLLRLSSHRLQLKEEEDEAIGRIEALFREAGLTVPAVSEVLAKSGVDAVRARTLLQILLKDKKLVRVSADLIYHSEAVEQLRALLAQRKGARFGVSEFKEWTGVSRKYAIPLLEFLDRERVTRRDGEQRMIL